MKYSFGFGALGTHLHREQHINPNKKHTKTNNITNSDMPTKTEPIGCGNIKNSGEVERFYRRLKLENRQLRHGHRSSTRKLKLMWKYLRLDRTIID